MKAEELRIGNWVSFKGLWNGKVKDISSSGIIQFEDNDGIFDIESMRPIPVNRYLLEKLGATDFPDGESLTLNNRLIRYAECRKEYYDVATSVTLASIHQYQNLLFALTGNELTIQL